MQSRTLANVALAGLAGAAMLTISMGPASAFTLASPSLEQSVASAQIDKVWWRRGYGWRGYGWRGYGWRGYGYPYGYGYGYHCWRGYYGRLHCN